jgi:hypothetical protein
MTIALHPNQPSPADPAPLNQDSAAAPLLFVGEAVGAEARAALVAAAGVRPLGPIALDALAERLMQQSRLAIIWLSDADPISADLADMVAREAARMDTAIVCELSGAALDAAFAAFAHVPGTQFLSAPDPLDREVALAAALGGRQPHVADAVGDAAMERIARLQEEVARISAALAALAGQGDAYPAAQRSAPVGFVPQLRSAERGYRAESSLYPAERGEPVAAPSAPVRRLLRQRRMREQFFPTDLFADPAWDMLLDLYAARLEGHMVAVSSLCIAAAVPATTALRWIKTMTDSGLFERQADPRDGRRIFIALAPAAADAMDRYFSAQAAMRD